MEVIVPGELECVAQKWTAYYVNGCSRTMRAATKLGDEDAPVGPACVCGGVCDGISEEVDGPWCFGIWDVAVRAEIKAKRRAMLPALSSKSL